MLKITPEVIAQAHKIVSTIPVNAAGYRLKVYPLPVDAGLKAGEKEKYSFLAAAGFQADTENQAARETKGAEMAIIVDIGEGAWANPELGSKPWAKIGQVIKHMRYAGHEFQDPPGSGNIYRLINDEDVMGYYPEVIE